jgi:DNA polymerase III epsilon subunit-like protein
MYVVLDTETSGLFNFALPADAEGQPRLAHLAMIFVDENLQEESIVDLLVHPDRWTMPPEVAAINHLPQEFLMEKGLPVAHVLQAYTDAVDRGLIVVAFNSQFDLKVMRGELRRAGMDDSFERTPNICVMRPLTDICKIPKANGKGYKFPKLSEAMAHFKIEQHGAHSAGGDARSALELFRKLKELGRCPEPSVNYAKKRPVSAMMTESGSAN